MKSNTQCNKLIKLRLFSPDGGLLSSAGINAEDGRIQAAINANIFKMFKSEQVCLIGSESDLLITKVKDFLLTVKSSKPGYTGQMLVKVNKIKSYLMEKL